MKRKINNLKDYAELSLASYFNFDYIKGQKALDFKITKTRFFEDGSELEKLEYFKVLNAEYNGYLILDNSLFIYPKLNGEFNELQAKNFSQRYEIKFHQSNTSSGFSATLFYDKEKDKFIVGFGETDDVMDVLADINLTFGDGDFQTDALKQFLLDISSILNEINSNKIIFTGHSLGGYLAQVALIYCDEIYKDELYFSPDEVYTFNAPSIYGWNIPNIIINLNIIKIMQDILGKYSIDISEKVTHIYDNSGSEIIASAQYSATNALGIYTGLNSHSIIPLIQTLYFYSYLLELKENENKIIKNNSLRESLENLNHFMENIQSYTETFVLKNNAINKKNFTTKNGPFALLRNSPKEINYFEYFLSTIAFIMQEAKDTLEVLGDDYYTHYKAPIINQTKIIDFILKIKEKEKYLLILNQNDFNQYKKDCSFINQQENLAYKIALGEFRVFIVVDKDMKCLENINNIAKIYGYNSKPYRIKEQIWDGQYLRGICKISQALYFNGKAKVGVV